MVAARRRWWEVLGVARRRRWVAGGGGLPESRGWRRVACAVGEIRNEGERTEWWGCGLGRFVFLVQEPLSRVYLTMARDGATGLVCISLYQFTVADRSKKKKVHRRSAPSPFFSRE